MGIIERRLSELKLVLPAASNPAANYANCVEAAGLLFVSGKAPVAPPGGNASGGNDPGGNASGGRAPRGKLGREYTTKDGYAFARATGLDILAVVQHQLGTLDRVARVVKLQGFINATDEFDEHPQVLNGCSDLMVEVFGDKGVHARSVLGAISLRGGQPIVIESIFEIAR